MKMYPINLPQGIATLCLLLALIACRTKQHSTKQESNQTRLELSAGHTEALNLSSRLERLDCLVLTLRHYDSLGRLTSVTQLEQRKETHQAESTLHSAIDSLRIKRSELTQRLSRAAAEPEVALPWWLYLVILAFGLLVCWRLARFFR